MSGIFIAAVPAGLPYDEPSHWANVAYWLTHHRMPRVGDSGVSYEAQMGPLAYVLDALFASPLWSVSEKAAFYGVRTLGVIQHLTLIILVWRLARRALPGHSNAPLFAATCVGLNPMLLTISTSVQNDTLTLLLVFIAVDIATARPTTTARVVAMGLAIGGAVLTKVSALPIGVALGLWLLARRQWGQALVYAAVTSAVAGWWFVRNQVLYGDLTARAAVVEAGYDFPPLKEFSPYWFARDATTYLWLPTEYVRNLVQAPWPVDCMVLLLMVAGIFGACCLASRKVSADIQVIGPLVASAVLSILGWIVVATTTQAVAFRLAYGALPLWFVAMASLATISSMRHIVWGIPLILVAIDLWFVQAVMQLGPTSFLPW